MVTTLTNSNLTQKEQGAVDRISQFKKLREQGVSSRDARNTVRLNPSISAQQLANPQEAPLVTPVAEPTIPNRINGTINNVLGSIRSKSESARKLAEEQSAFQSFAQNQSGFDIQNEQLKRFGATPEKLQELEDIQLQLTDMNTESLQTRSDIARADGQTVSQGSREISAEQARDAVRSTGLAARAAVLQGSLNTARQLANDATQIALADRTFQANAQLQAIADLKDVVDEETRQLLQSEERGYQAELDQIDNLRENISTAITSGASQLEIDQLTSDTLSDEDKISLAQSITARGENEMRDLEISGARLGNAIKAEQLKSLREPTQATRPTEIIEVNGVKQLVDTQTGDVIATFEAGTSTNEIEVARDTAFVNNMDSLKDHPGLNSSVGPVGLARVGLADQFGAKDEFIGSVENIVRALTINTFAEAKAKGMTFGAMSEGEWRILGESATKIAQWRQYKKEGIPGFRDTTEEVAGYDIDEASFKKELDVLSNFGKMDALRKGAAPADIGVQIIDGEYWTQNSDGTFTQLDITPQ